MLFLRVANIFPLCFVWILAGAWFDDWTLCKDVQLCASVNYIHNIGNRVSGCCGGVDSLDGQRPNIRLAFFSLASIMKMPIPGFFTSKNLRRKIKEPNSMSPLLWLMKISAIERDMKAFQSYDNKRFFFVSAFSIFLRKVAKRRRAAVWKENLIFLLYV